MGLIDEVWNDVKDNHPGLGMTKTENIRMLIDNLHLATEALTDIHISYDIPWIQRRAKEALSKLRGEQGGGGE